jgi:hypothetical protein
MGDQQSRAHPEEVATKVVSTCKYWENERTYWSRNKPIDVSDVEDLTVGACDHRVASLELNRDSGVTQVGSHSEVRDGCDESDGSGDVVENAVLTWDREAQTHEGDGCNSHDCGDSPIPVGTMGGKVDIGGHRVVENIGVCVQRIISSLGNVRHLD